MSGVARSIFRSICGRTGRGVTGGAERSPWVTDIQTGLSPGMTITGGPTYVADYLGTLRRTPAGYAAIEGGKYVTTVEDGAVLGPELITNAADREFTSDTGYWTKNSGATISSGVATTSGTQWSGISRSLTISRLSLYLVSFDITLEGADGIYNVQLGFNGQNSTDIITSGRKDIYLQFLTSATNSTIYLQKKSTSVVGVYATIDNVSVREVIPQWLPAPAEPSILVPTRKGLRTVYNDPDYLGQRIEPAATQYFQYPTAPATHTTVSMPIGTYTLWIEGSGSVTATAGTAVGTFGAATEAAPATITITTAGTTVLTVAGTVTFGQLENLPYKSSHIPENTTTTFTRAAVVTSAPTAGVFPASGQDFAILMRVVPAVSAQSNVIIISMTSGSDYIQINHSASNTLRITKFISSVVNQVDTAYIGTKDVPFNVIAIQTSHGMSIKHREYSGGTWQAWGVWNNNVTAGGKLAAKVGATYCVASRSGTTLYMGVNNYPLTAIIQMPPKATLAEYQTWIETHLTQKGLI